MNFVVTIIFIDFFDNICFVLKFVTQDPIFLQFFLDDLIGRESRLWLWQDSEHLKFLSDVGLQLLVLIDEWHIREMDGKKSAMLLNSLDYTLHL